MSLVYVSREQWGSTASTESFIANRFSAAAPEKTTIQVHHTARPDDDPTRNRWTYDDAARYMRALQTARPELGPLPYSLNVAVSEDTDTVWLFEGRGILKVGAHTAGHNRDGVGYGIFGNFDLRDDPSAFAAIGAVESDVALRRSENLVNLGQEKNPRGWNAWGHRDSSPKSCPGNHLYPMLANFTLDPGDDDNMWQYLNIDESLVRHAHAQGWLQPKTQATLDYFLGHLADLQEAVAPAHFAKDWLNFRRAVSNGIARAKPVGPGTPELNEAQVRAIIDGHGHTATVELS